MNSAATANDLKKDLQERLQIDAGLANATDLTAASTFTTPVSDVMRNDNGISDEWKNFYVGVDKAPPKATRDVEYQVAVAKANDLLRLSDIEDFEIKSFEDLTDDQKAILMFMITKEMDEIPFRGGRTADVLVGALKPETEDYKRMFSFVRLGGDSNCCYRFIVVKKFDETRQEFVKDCPDATTIFQNNGNMYPCLYIQSECSYICTFHACSALMYYGSHSVRSKPGEDKSAFAIQANISRYIRDEIGGEAIANFTLTTRKGAYLKDILTGLMKSFGTAGQEPDCIQLQEEHEDYNYARLLLDLQVGDPFVLSIECFPGLKDAKKKEYTGKLSDHYRNQNVNYSERPEKPEDRSYHAVLCIGIKPRKGETPPMLLVQDSYHIRPAFSVGLDLLMDMGIRNLQFCKLHPDWTPNPGMCYEVTKKTKVFFAGSPMSIDKNSEVHILTTPKEPVPEKRDMSRYLHNAGHQVYVT